MVLLLAGLGTTSIRQFFMQFAVEAQELELKRLLKEHNDVSTTADEVIDESVPSADLHRVFFP